MKNCQYMKLIFRNHGSSYVGDSWGTAGDCVDLSLEHCQGGRDTRVGGVQLTAVVEVLRSVLVGGGQGREGGNSKDGELHCGVWWLMRCINNSDIPFFNEFQSNQCSFQIS